MVRKGSCIRGSGVLRMASDIFGGTEDRISEFVCSEMRPLDRGWACFVASVSSQQDADVGSQVAARICPERFIEKYSHVTNFIELSSNNWAISSGSERSMFANARPQYGIFRGEAAGSEPWQGRRLKQRQLWGRKSLWREIVYIEQREPTK